MQLKTLNRSGRVVLKDYTEQECCAILCERNGYVLECTHRSGVDYGGGRTDEETREYYEEIVPERILVKNGRFCGVLILTEYQYYNGGGDKKLEEIRLMADDGGSGCARSGYSISTDDRSRWDYTDYRLIKRPD